MTVLGKIVRWVIVERLLVGQLFLGRVIIQADYNKAFVSSILASCIDIELVVLKMGTDTCQVVGEYVW